MSKPYDYETRDQVLGFIKTKYQEGDGSPVSIALDDIRTGINKIREKDKQLKNNNKIWRLVKNLENADIIRIIERGEGARAHRYVYIGEGSKELINEVVANGMGEDLQTIYHNTLIGVKKLFNYNLTSDKELRGQVVNINYLKAALGELELMGSSSDGKPIFISKNKDSRLPAIIEQIKKENKTIVKNIDKCV